MVVIIRPEGGFFVVVVEDGEVTGKLWLFRYWKRDDVHCLTKGWGCYAREKGLRAGDTVSFHSTACGRFFICCRCTCMSFLSLPTTSHRIHGSSVLPQPRAAQAAHHPFSGHATLCLGNKASDHSAPARHATASLGCAAAQPPQVPPTPPPRRRRRSMMVPPEPPEHTTDGMPVILESMALVSTPPVAKRVRLFGVYIDVPPLRPGGEATQDFNPWWWRAIRGQERPQEEASCCGQLTPPDRIVSFRLQVLRHSRGFDYWILNLLGLWLLNNSLVNIMFFGNMYGSRNVFHHLLY